MRCFDSIQSQKGGSGQKFKLKMLERRTKDNKSGDKVN